MNCNLNYSVLTIYSLVIVIAISHKCRVPLFAETLLTCKFTK